MIEAYKYKIGSINLLMYFFVMLLSASIFLIQYYSADINIGFFSRLSLFGSFVLFLISFRSVSEKLYNQNVFLNILSLSMICVLLVAIYTFNIEKPITTIILTLLSFYMIATLFNMSKLLNSKISSALSVILAIFAVLAPPLTGKYLNNESFVSEYYDQLAYNNVRNYSELKNKYIEVQLNKDERINLETNILKANSYEETIHMPAWAGDSFKFFVFNTQYDISSLCLLGQYTTGSNGYKSLKECLIDINTRSRIARTRLVEGVSKINFLLSPIEKKNIFNFLNSNNYAIIKENVPGLTKNILGYSYLIGGYFHHYQAIGRSVFGSEIKFDNQYGAGPVLLISIINKFISSTPFDSVYILSISANVIIFVFVFLILLREKSVSTLTTVSIGFSLSIAIIFMGSNMMAPMLYAVRMLPTLFIGLYIFRSRRNHLGEVIIPWPFLLILTLYNFEYAILTLLALFFAQSVLISKKSLYYLFFITIAAAIRYFVKDPNINSVSYGSYITGFGLGQLAHPLVIIYFFVLAILSLPLLQKRCDATPAYRAMYFICLFVSFKAMWNGSYNHVGYAILLVSFLCVMYTEHVESINNIVNNIFITFSIICLPFLLLHMMTFTLNNKIDSYIYVPTPVSDIFLVERELYEVGAEAAKIVKQYDSSFLISPIDNYVMLFTRRQLTTVKPDLSTNLKTDNDLNLVNEFLINNYRGYIIVDKSVAEPNIVFRKRNETVLDSLVHRKSLSKYQNNIRKMQKLYDSILQSGMYYKCETTKNFLVYCARR